MRVELLSAPSPAYVIYLYLFHERICQKQNNNSIKQNIKGNGQTPEGLGSEEESFGRDLPQGFDPEISVLLTRDSTTINYSYYMYIQVLSARGLQDLKKQSVTAYCRIAGKCFRINR